MLTETSREARVVKAMREAANHHYEKTGKGYWIVVMSDKERSLLARAAIAAMPLPRAEEMREEAAALASGYLYASFNADEVKGANKAKADIAAAIRALPSEVRGDKEGST